MEIKGKISVFKKKAKDRVYFVGSITKKLDNGVLESVSVDIRFGKDFNIELKENCCSVLNVESGFISCDKYTNKDGVEVRKLVLVITQAKLEKETPYTAREAL